MADSNFIDQTGEVPGIRNVPSSPLPQDNLDKDQPLLDKKKEQEAKQAQESEFEKNLRLFLAHIKNKDGIIAQVWGKDGIEQTRVDASSRILAQHIKASSLSLIYSDDNAKSGFTMDIGSMKGGYRSINYSSGSGQESILGQSKGFGANDAESIIALAALHGWKTVELMGNKSQKKALYLAAMGQGLDTKGYEPDALTLEQGKLARAKWEQGHPELAQTGVAVPAADAPDEAAPTRVKGIRTKPVKGGLGRSTVIDPESPASMALLEAAYDAVYKPCFPMEDERETKEDLIQYTKDGKDEGVTVTVLGDRLGTKDQVIKGIAVVYNYEDKGRAIGLLGHLGVAEGYRNKQLGGANETGGIGSVLYDLCRKETARQAKEYGQTMGFMVHECNPIGTENDNMDPAKRIDWYKRRGVVPVPFAYAQQPLTMDGNPVPLVLMAEPNPAKKGEYPSVEDIKIYLKAMHKEAKDFVKDAIEENRTAEKPQDEQIFKDKLDVINKTYKDMLKDLNRPEFAGEYQKAIAERKAALSPKFNESMIAGVTPAAPQPAPVAPALSKKDPDYRGVGAFSKQTRTGP